VNIFADENVPQPIVARLREEGHHVEYVIELIRGIDDVDVLNRANQQRALLLTADKDFGDLVIRQRCRAAGVVLLRLAPNLPPAQKAEIVASALQKHGSKLLYAFTVITPRAVRIRPVDIDG
jgi:predicted nuclease of predicted toxin-antitoxin system